MLTHCSVSLALTKCFPSSFYISIRFRFYIHKLPVMEGGEPKPKAARTSCIQARLPYISSNGLSAILRLAKEEALPEATSRRSLQRARDKDVFVETAYGKVHQTIDLDTVAGDVCHVEVQHPLAMLHRTCATSIGFSSLLQQSLEASPNSPTSPLRLVFYCDEVLPGNPLAIKTDRKLWAFYWSILNLGPAALSHEENVHSISGIVALCCVAGAAARLYSNVMIELLCIVDMCVFCVCSSSSCIMWTNIYKLQLD